LTRGGPRPSGARRRRRAVQPPPADSESIPPGASASVVESRVRAALWTTVPTALATEAGALAVIALGALPGVVVGIAGVVVLQLALGRLAPASRTVRLALVVGGPPLRYGLLLIAVWYEWAVRGSGPQLALAAGLLLGFVVPMIGSVLTAPRHRPAGP
jgi:hypothetical protein